MFLLIDIADFGKINLKNLSKLQNLKIDGDDFTRASGLTRPSSVGLKIHDEITHKAIKPTAQKYLVDGDKIKYNSKARKLSFLPIANPINQLKSGLPYTEKYNSSLERLTNRLEGNMRSGSSPETSLAKGLRKRGLTKAEKIATKYQDSPIVKDLITTKRPVTQEDVTDFIREIKKEQGKRKQQPKKIKGNKLPQDTALKRFDMESRQRFRKYGMPRDENLNDIINKNYVIGN